MGAFNPRQLRDPSQLHRVSDRSRHDVQFYSEDKFLLSSVGSLLAHSLCTGGSAIIIATRSHRDGIREVFKSHNLDPASLVDEGRYIALDAEETLATLMSEGAVKEDAFVDIVGGIISRAIAFSPAALTPVAVFGEMVALLWQQGATETAFQLEQMWNRLAETLPFTLLCGYPLSSFDPQEKFDSLLNICAEHTTVIYSDSASVLLRESEFLRCVIGLRHDEEDALESMEGRRDAINKTVALHDQNVALVRQLQKRQLTDEARSATLKSLAINLAILERDLELSPHGRQIAERSLVLIQVLLEDVRQLYSGIEPRVLPQP